MELAYEPSPVASLSEQIGTPWSETEIKLFFDAFREFGNDWERIASKLSGRDQRMVSAFHAMNASYLASSEASAQILVHIMADRHNQSLAEAAAANLHTIAAAANLLSAHDEAANHQKKAPKKSPMINSNGKLCRTSALSKTFKQDEGPAPSIATSRAKRIRKKKRIFRHASLGHFSPYYHTNKLPANEQQ